MQNKDGGWGAFDKDCDNEVLTFIPFADHNAMIDPELRRHHRPRPRGPPRAGRARRTIPPFAAPRAILERRQHPDGTWYGRWGCNYIYGTWLALRGLLHAGEDLREPRFQRAADWLRAHQNADGGWGELPAELRRSEREGPRPAHPVADRLGADGALRRRRPRVRHRPPGRRIPALAPGLRRLLEGRALDRDGLPARSSTCAITSTRPTSRCGRSRSTARGGRRLGDARRRSADDAASAGP